MSDVFELLNNYISGQPGRETVVDDTMVAESFDDLIVPQIKPQKREDGRKRICVIDDDFSTLDLMNIYLQRNYDYVSFDHPKDAIFYLNGNIPDLIFIDCYLYTIPTRKVIEIIRTYKELETVPIVYLCEKEEYGTIIGKLPQVLRIVFQDLWQEARCKSFLIRYLIPNQKRKLNN